MTYFEQIVECSLLIQMYTYSGGVKWFELCVVKNFRVMERDLCPQFFQVQQNTSNLCFHCQHEMSIAEDPFEDKGLYFVCKRIVFNRLQPFRLFPPHQWLR